MDNNIVYTTEINLYTEYEKRSPSRTTRRCIDGRITGCGNCVGYCQYIDHPGFLTANQREEHDCINKKCNYYIPKPHTPRRNIQEEETSLIPRLAQQSVAEYDDLRIMNATQHDHIWIIGYVTVFGEYNFTSIEEQLQKEVGVAVSMQKLNYSFERCVELMCAGS